VPKHWLEQATLHNNLLYSLLISYNKEDGAITILLLNEFFFFTNVAEMSLWQ